MHGFRPVRVLVGNYVRRQMLGRMVQRRQADVIVDQELSILRLELQNYSSSP